MDIVLGVSVAPEAVRTVLVEGEAAGGVTVDQDGFDLAGGATPVAAADQVVATILGTREIAAVGGYRLRSSGVTWTNPAEAAALRDALAAHKIESVMLISSFMAAAALAQSVGSATNCARTALLFVEPTTATLAVVDTSDGSIADVHRQPLPSGDDEALAKVAAMVSSVESMKARPDGVFVVGSDVDIALIKPTLDAATSLSVTTPEEPEMALARGAALAAANAELGAPRTVAMPYAQDLPTAGRGLAYSAEADDESDPASGDYRESVANPGERRSRKFVLAVVGATVIFVGGVVALALALAIGIRPHAEQRPDVSKNVVAPVTQAPPPAAVPAPESGAPPQAPTPIALAPGPSLNPPQQGPSLHPKDDDHRWEDWLRHHVGPGIPVP